MWRRIAIVIVTILVPTGILALLGFLLGAWKEGNHPISAALLTATGTALAASVAILVWEYKAHLDRDTAEKAEWRVRSERVRDTVSAIAADVASDLKLLRQAFGDGEIARQLQDFDRLVAECDPHPLPRSAQSTKRLIFAAIEKDISILPEKLIRPVLTYYEIDIDMGALTERFSSGKFDNLSPARQREGLVQYLEMGKTATTAAETLSAAVEDWLANSTPSNGANDRRKHGKIS